MTRSWQVVAVTGRMRAKTRTGPLAIGPPPCPRIEATPGLKTVKVVVAALAPSGGGGRVQWRYFPAFRVVRPSMRIAGPSFRLLRP